MLRSLIRILVYTNNCTFFFAGPLDETKSTITVCADYNFLYESGHCIVSKTIPFRKCGDAMYIFFLDYLEYCGAYCVGKNLYTHVSSTCKYI